MYLLTLLLSHLRNIITSKKFALKQKSLKLDICSVITDLFTMLKQHYTKPIHYYV